MLQYSLKKSQIVL